MQYSHIIKHLFFTKISYAIDFAVKLLQKCTTISQCCINEKKGVWLKTQDNTLVAEV